ncbi:MAG: RsmG family class I SAM-dependent methyltransferase [Polyangiales bacterium]
MDALATWLELVARWNRKIDLTAARDDAALAELGVLDAAVIANHLDLQRDPRARVVDVGTGFGAPGLALALLRADLDLTLVEPLGKRASFLRTCLGATKIADRARVVEATGAAVVATGDRFDAAISRATLAPAAWLALGEALSPSGPVVLLLAREPAPASASRAIAWDVSYETSSGAPRRAVALAHAAC